MIKATRQSRSTTLTIVYGPIMIGLGVPFSEAASDVIFLGYGIQDVVIHYTHFWRVLWLIMSFPAGYVLFHLGADEDLSSTKPDSIRYTTYFLKRGIPFQLIPMTILLMVHSVFILDRSSLAEVLSRLFSASYYGFAFSVAAWRVILRKAE